MLLLDHTGALQAFSLSHLWKEPHISLGFIGTFLRHGFLLSADHPIAPQQSISILAEVLLLLPLLLIYILAFLPYKDCHGAQEPLGHEAQRTIHGHICNIKQCIGSYDTLFNQSV